MRWLMVIGAAVVGFLIAFGFSARDEIAADVDRRLDEDFVNQCMQRAQFPPELAGSEREICTCMKGEFDERGLKLTDALGSKRAEMREITQECALYYR